MNTLMLSPRERLLQILNETSFHSNPTPIYRLASGTMSQYYIDCKIALSYPEVRELVGELIFERICDMSIDAVGGMALGAYPIAIAISDLAYRKYGKNILAFVVRKEPKAYGLKKYIEGHINEGYKVLIVDDVITTGKSTIDAIIRSQNEGLKIVKAMAIIDRQEGGGRENIENYGVSFDPLFTLQDLQALRDR